MISIRFLFSGLIPVVLLGAGLVRAAEPDELMPRLIESPLLTPHFSHLDTPTTVFFDRGTEPARYPIVSVQQQQSSNRSLLSSALAIEWQHQMSSSQRFSFSAQVRDQVQTFTDSLSTTSNSAAVGWSQQLGHSSLLRGQLFLGDKDLKDRSNGYSGYRYYGLSFEGRYSPWRDHTPFAGLRWQRNDYDPVDPATAALPRNEGISRFSAGWEWQVSPGFDVRAEAQYRLTDEVLDPADQDRLQFYFRSRYGFR